MKTRIALLRGINVGGRNKLPMKELVPVLEKLGCGDVRTYIQSGNVVFRQDRDDNPADAIAGAIEGEFGFRPGVLVIDETDLERAWDQNPFDATEGKALHFLFLESASAEPDLERIEALKAASESWLLKGRVFYLHAPDGIARSKLAAGVEKCLGVTTTGRNANTVARLRAMVAEK